MKNQLLLALIVLSNVYFVLGQEFIEPIPKGTLTIVNQTSEMAFFWFAGYIQVGKKAFKKWHPDYNSEKKTVRPLVLLPGKGAKISVKNDECFFWMYAWWGAGHDKADKKINTSDRCRNVTVYLRGTKKLELVYEIELTQQEIQERDQQKDEEEAKLNQETSGMEESQEEEPETTKKRKGYFV